MPIDPSSSPSDCVYIADWEPSGVVGWEANSTGKLAPCQVDLGPSMDPHRLAESAVTLNVSLMRWRAAPSLGIDRLQDLKILLLGAGKAVAPAPVMSCVVLCATDGSNEQNMWCSIAMCCNVVVLIASGLRWECLRNYRDPGVRSGKGPARMGGQTHRRCGQLSGEFPADTSWLHCLAPVSACLPHSMPCSEIIDSRYCCAMRLPPSHRCLCAW